MRHSIIAAVMVFTIGASLTEAQATPQSAAGHSHFAVTILPRFVRLS